jgi:hypothetical protein
MKKIFTLVLISFFTLAAMAFDRRPTLSIKNNTHYKVIIDGRVMRNDYDGSYEIRNMKLGRHTVTVIEEKNSMFFGRRDRVVSRTDFKVDGNDRRILIYVGRSGNVNIRKDESGNSRNNRDYDDRNEGYDKRNGDGRSYDWNESRDYDYKDWGKDRPNDRGNGKGNDRENDRQNKKF